MKKRIKTERGRLRVRWQNMMRKCYNSKCIWYPSYGARGIFVCERWHNFENYIKDIGLASIGFSIDRIDNDGPYSPENCRITNRKVQQNNLRWNRRFMFNGTMATISEIAEHAVVPRCVLSNRLRTGWSVEVAISTPLQKRPEVA